MTDNSVKKTAAEAIVEQRNGRRRMLRTTLAMATGVGLQSLLTDRAVADQHAGNVITPNRSAKKLMGPMQEAIQACLDCHSMCLGWL